MNKIIQIWDNTDKRHSRCDLIKTKTYNRTDYTRTACKCVCLCFLASLHQLSKWNFWSVWSALIVLITVWCAEERAVKGLVSSSHFIGGVARRAVGRSHAGLVKIGAGSVGNVAETFNTAPLKAQTHYLQQRKKNARNYLAWTSRSAVCLQLQHHRSYSLPTKWKKRWFHLLFARA